MFRAILCFGFFAVLTLAPSAFADLSLIATVDGERIALQDIGVNRFLGDSPQGRRVVPLDAAISLEGDLAKHAALVRWIATYYLVHAPGRDSLPAIARPWFGYVRLVNGKGWNGPSFDEVWPKRPAEPLLAVFAWCVGGKVVQTRVQRLPTETRDTMFRVDQMFQLSESEAAGFGIVLLWAKGRFLPPKPYFSSSATEAALHAMMTGSPDEFEAALSKISGNFLRPGDTLLWQAADIGNDTAVEALLRSGIKADNVFDPLPSAVNRGRVAVLERLLQGRKIKHPALALPLRYGHDAAVRLFLSHAAPSFRPGSDLIEAALEGGFADLARDFIARGGRVDVGATARCARLLTNLIKDGHVAAAQVLLEQKVDPNAAVDERSPLFLAAQLGEHDIVDALLRAGAKPNVGDAAGTTPLMVACQSNDLACVTRLLDRGADARTPRKDGMTALHFAAAHAVPDLVQRLLARGADASPVMQPAPLEFALLAGAARTAEVLAAHGARVNLQRPHAARVLEAAVRLDRAELVRDALDRGWHPAADWSAPWPADVCATLVGAAQVRTVLAALPPAAPASTAPVMVAPPELDAPPQLLRSPTLTDPRDGRASGPAAVVELRAIVDELGRLQCPRVQQSPDGRLSFLALQTLGQWRFSPPQKNGAAACTEIVIPITFQPSPREVFDRSEVDAAPCRLTFRDARTPLVVERVGNSGYRASPAALENDVRVQVVLTVRGEVNEPRVMNRVESYEGSSALRAIGDWSFTPGVRKGKPVATRHEVVFER